MSNKPVVGTLRQLFILLLVKCKTIAGFVKYTRRGNEGEGFLNAKPDDFLRRDLRSSCCVIT